MLLRQFLVVPYHRGLWLPSSISESLKSWCVLSKSILRAHRGENSLVRVHRGVCGLKDMVRRGEFWESIEEISRDGRLTGLQDCRQGCLSLPGILCTYRTQRSIATKQHSTGGCTFVKKVNKCCSLFFGHLWVHIYIKKYRELFNWRNTFRGKNNQNLSKLLFYYYYYVWFICFLTLLVYTVCMCMVFIFY